MVSRNETTLGVIVLILSQTVRLLRQRNRVTKRSNEPANFREEIPAVLPERLTPLRNRRPAEARTLLRGGCIRAIAPRVQAFFLHMFCAWIASFLAYAQQIVTYCNL